ncbi:MAG: 30S ribosomal protein S6 [Candidatus Paceibacterota bacterium]|jgi:ribosomal protein S6
MSNDYETKEYELSVLLKDEAGLENVRTILRTGGLDITDQTELKHIALAYPIKKETMAYMTTMRCVTQPDADLKEVSKGLEVDPGCLRFLLLAHPIVPAVRMPRASHEAPHTPRPYQAAPVAQEEQHKGEVVSNEELEKKLEEILQ